jgi:hypothetical protein
LKDFRRYHQGESSNRKNLRKNHCPAGATHIGDERIDTIIAAWDRLPEEIKDELAGISIRNAQA